MELVQIGEHRPHGLAGASMSQLAVISIMIDPFRRPQGGWLPLDGSNHHARPVRGPRWRFAQDLRQPTAAAATRLADTMK
ncbi:MAG TPA: hypothetical protein VHT91_41180 [Kofleriaceae bacterium]|nr:hypothetical protein [Kofleriaceae bacterium]